MSKYRLIFAEKANFEITMVCPLLEMGRSAYYAWSGRADDEAAALAALHKNSEGTYGALRILADLRAEVEVVFGTTVARE